MCALALSASPISSQTGSQADTLNIYILNGTKVANFDGSQLVGKTVSDYKTMIATSNCNGVTTVTKVHNICTNGKKAKNMTMTTSTTTVDGKEASSVSSVKADDSYVSYSVTGDDSKMEVYIDGKKSTKEELGKLKPDRIASMTVMQAGSEAAMKLTKDKTVSVIMIETIKKK